MRQPLLGRGQPPRRMLRRALSRHVVEPCRGVVHELPFLPAVRPPVEMGARGHVVRVEGVLPAEHLVADVVGGVLEHLGDQPARGAVRHQLRLFGVAVEEEREEAEAGGLLVDEVLEEGERPAVGGTAEVGAAGGRVGREGALCGGGGASCRVEFGALVEVGGRVFVLVGGVRGGGEEGVSVVGPGPFELIDEDVDGVVFVVHAVVFPEGSVFFHKVEELGLLFAVLAQFVVRLDGPDEAVDVLLVGLDEIEIFFDLRVVLLGSLAGGGGGGQSEPQVVGGSVGVAGAAGDAADGLDALVPSRVDLLLLEALLVAVAAVLAQRRGRVGIPRQDVVVFVLHRHQRRPQTSLLRFRQADVALPLRVFDVALPPLLALAVRHLALNLLAILLAHFRGGKGAAGRALVLTGVHPAVEHPLPPLPPHQLRTQLGRARSLGRLRFHRLFALFALFAEPQPAAQVGRKRRPLRRRPARSARSTVARRRQFASGRGARPGLVRVLRLLFVGGVAALHRAPPAARPLPVAALPRRRTRGRHAADAGRARHAADAGRAKARHPAHAVGPAAGAADVVDDTAERTRERVALFGDRRGTLLR
mmetsp:Transcript_37943/g.74290  ORF Transcript_37943/g.74290 Transcript_37943/m.74290 type:complete len:590 (-) Transcript_37943:60-1829(-)